MDKFINGQKAIVNNKMDKKPFQLFQVILFVLSGGDRRYCFSIILMVYWSIRVEQFIMLMFVWTVVSTIGFWYWHNEYKSLQTQCSKINVALVNCNRRYQDLLAVRDGVVRECNQLKANIKDLKLCLVQKDQFYETLQGEKSKAFNHVSCLISDFITLQYQKSATFLEEKKRPALKEAKRIRELKEETKAYIRENRILRYKYEYLFGIFPDLKNYVDDLESLEELDKFSSVDKFNDEVDTVRSYLSNVEYKSLPEDERHQLALDRYLKGRKTNWQIGRDYEMFIGQEYEKSGWEVEYIGIQENINDMGRDLITRKGNKTHIVQCKYWSKHKSIHENTITQLYGTAIQYVMANAKKINDVTPVLVTNIELSKTALEFAKYLGVEVRHSKKLEDFPRIKCKQNKGERGAITKIYHLPMDQQYDKAKITSSEYDFYAFTVSEAVAKGYRRAFRWKGSA